MVKKLLFLIALMLSFVGIYAQSTCTAPTGLKVRSNHPEWRNTNLS